MLKPLCLGAIVALLASAQICAQSKVVYVDVSLCLAMEADAERHACYVALGEAARSALPASPATAAVRASVEQPGIVAQSNAADQTQEAVEEFGRELPAAIAQEESNARILANENGDQELVDTIAMLDERMPNTWDVTLSNDQVWRQVNSDAFNLREGMEVRIYPSPMSGSFRLSAKGKNGFIQVRRIR